MLLSTQRVLSNTKPALNVTMKGHCEQHKYYRVEVRNAYQYLESKCINPVPRPNRLNLNEFVSCGKCVYCLKAKRNQASFRIKQEQEHPMCISTFGVTLTYGFKMNFDFAESNLLYNSYNVKEKRVNNDKINKELDKYLDPRYKETKERTVPYLPKEILDKILDARVNHDFDSIKQYYYGGSLKVQRGATPSMLKSGKYVAIANTEDVHKYLGILETKINKKYNTEEAVADLCIRLGIGVDKLPYKDKAIVLRHYICSDYGDTYGCCGLPHYHGIFFIFGSCEALAKAFKANQSNQLIADEIQYEIEKMAMNLWKYSARHFDKQKRIWYGKDIHDTSGNWCEYLGKYINKESIAQYAKGCHYVPEVVMCSKTSHKYGIGSIGQAYIKENYHRFCVDLEKSLRDGVVFNPIYSENGFKKALPSALRKQFLLKYFKVRSSDFNLYCTWQSGNVHQYVDKQGKTYFATDAFSKVPHSIAKEYIPNLKGCDEYGHRIVKKVGDGLPFKQVLELRKRCKALYDFCNKQTELRCAQYVTLANANYHPNPTYDNDAYTLLSGQESSLSRTLCYIDATDGSIIADFEGNEDKDNLSAKRLVYAINERHLQNVKNEQEIRENVLAKKFAHAVHNGYLVETDQYIGNSAYFED